MALAVCACGNSPAAPSNTAPPSPEISSINISAPATLIVGQTGRVTASVTYANQQTLGLPNVGAWTSSNPAIVSVDSTGTLTGVALGSAAISLAFGGKTGSTNVGVSATAPIATCGAFTGGTAFTVSADLSSQGVGCLTFTGLTNATLDCQGHDISSVLIQNTNGFSIKNCKVHAGVNMTFRIANSSMISVDASDVLGNLRLDNVQNSSFTNSVFRWPLLPPSSQGFESSEVYLNGGSGDRFIQDSIDGGWDGNVLTYMQQGCDDGVTLLSAQNATIQNSTIANVFDAGVEAITGDVITNATIAGNTFTRNGYTAIGNYYGPGWQNSTFSGNTSTATPSLFYFVKPAKVVTVTFVNNRITDNVVRDQVPLAPYYGGRTVEPAYINYLAGAGSVTSGNVVQGNNFGLVFSPVLLPADGFIDGGGNHCVSSSASNMLTCLAPSSNIRR